MAITRGAGRPVQAKSFLNRSEKVFTFSQPVLFPAPGSQRSGGNTSAARWLHRPGATWGKPLALATGPYFSKNQRWRAEARKR